MSVQQFCLRWNNHQPNFISVFTNLLNSESLVDVTLAAEGRHLQAHKVVLSACSSYFQTLFSVNPCQHPIVILKDVKYNDLKTMVDFMYYGEVNVSQEQLPAILKTAEMLKIKGLAEMPEHGSHLSKSLSLSSDKGELLVPGDMGWDMARQSASPGSPSLRRKRLRKSSTGSGSGSTERTSEELPGEITLIPSPIVKPEPIPMTPDGESARSDGSLRTSIQEPSTDSEPRDGSQGGSMEEEPGNVSMPQDGTSSIDAPPEDPGPGPSMMQHQIPVQGPQWMLLDNYGFPEPPACAVSGPYLSPSPCPSPCFSSCPSPAAPRRKRSVNPQADENFVRALEAVRFGGIGFCKAARMFGVNNRTLWLEYRKRGYPVLRPSLKSRVKTDSDTPSVPPPPPPPPLPPPPRPPPPPPSFPPTPEPRVAQFASLPPRPRYPDPSMLSPPVSVHGLNFSPM